MEIVAPVSKYKQNSLFITITVVVGVGLWFLYDGYFNESFIQEYTNTETGEPQWQLTVNRQAPPFLFLGAVLVGGYWLLIRHRKIVATDTELVVSKKLSIPYDAIEAIDKTHFTNKGFFEVRYKQTDGKEAKTRLDDRQFDQLQPILDHLIAQIT